MINVTKTYLPNKDRYIEYLNEIYCNGWVTNNGLLVQKLENRLAEYFNVKNIVLVSNGTMALEIAYRVLNLSGFVLTTPFSFVATTNSLIRNQLSPIFVDIDLNSFNINSENIEKLITTNTSAIVPVHVFGNACEVEKIEYIAKKYNLKVVYDAAHAFGVKYKNKSVLNYGDISVLSFHATKLFHTIEGGALIINNNDLAQKARYLINFGIKNAEEIPYIGTNAKMNEFEAAMGLCVLDDIEIINQERKMIFENYQKKLEGLVSFQKQNKNSTKNYSYCPILFKSEAQLLTVKKALNAKQIFPRRYFYPSLDTLPYIEPKQECNISKDISKRILCLPIYVGLKKEIQDIIIEIIKGNL